MKLNTHKIYVVATTEFGSAIRTKAFLVSLLLLPVIMGASILLQVFVAERVDTKPRKFVVIDKSGALYPAIEQAAAAHNAKLPEARGKNARPRMEPEPAAARAEDLSLALDLSDRVHRGELDAYVEIPAGVIEPAAGDATLSALEYHSNNPNDDAIRNRGAWGRGHGVRPIFKLNLKIGSDPRRLTPPGQPWNLAPTSVGQGHRGTLCNRGSWRKRLLDAA